jgi:hypothetical protein
MESVDILKMPPRCHLWFTGRQRCHPYHHQKRKSGAVQVSYDFYGLSNPTNKIDILNAQEYASYEQYIKPFLPVHMYLFPG